MIDLHFAPTPNGWKLTIFLEEAGLPYRIVPVSFATSGQYAPQFLAIAPNNRIPALVDHAPADGGEPLALFESGAMLHYLARKAGQFLPTDPRGEARTMQWLMWQMSGLGPMLGQHGHFALYAAERHPYAIERYHAEARRLYGVLDGQLGRTGAFVAGEDYTIADMAVFPWAMTHKAQGFSLDDWPQVKRWYAQLRARPALQRGLAVGREERRAPSEMDEAARAKFFGIGLTTTMGPA